MQKNTDTIAAIATAHGCAGVGVVRVSGEKAAQIAHLILGFMPRPRHAHYASFQNEGAETIDQGLALLFVAPHSYTGEDVLELQGHGGPAVLQMVLQRCVQLGARLAEPGEFTRRAYLNNKLDLAQAEAVVDLISATTARAASSAMKSLAGEFSAAINSMVSELIGLRLLVEAMLDFPEEELDGLDIARRDGMLQAIRLQLTQALLGAQQGSLLREGAHVVLVGQPNVGKSSLLNCLSGEMVALVSDVPGTTRDVIRKEIQIDGIPLHIIDTAGLRDSCDVVEKMGMELTRRTIDRADLILFLREASKPVSEQERAVLASLPAHIPQLHVVNKIDLLSQQHNLESSNGVVSVSAKTGAGIDALRSRLLRLIGWTDVDGGVFMARERHLLALGRAKIHFDAAESVMGQPTFFAEELRLAQQALSEITGEFTADDLLGEIFSRFCIGK